MEDQGGVSEGRSSKGKRIRAHIPQMWAFLVRSHQMPFAWHL